LLIFKFFQLEQINPAFDKEFEISGSPPSFDTYGRTPEERAGMRFWIFNLQE
jgi:hypothetical protein